MVSTARADRLGRRLHARTTVAALIVALLALAGGALLSAPAQAASAPRDSIDNEFVTLINKARADAGLPALIPVGSLRNLSVWWSVQMADDLAGASCSLKHNPDAWNQLPGYGAANRTAWAENVALWTTDRFTTQAIFDSYMNSAGHRANILGATYRYVGVGTVSTTGSCGTRDYNTMTFTDKVDNPPTPSTSTPPPVPNTFGRLESVTRSGATIAVKGWAVDPANPTQVVKVRITDYGTATTRYFSNISAGAARATVGTKYPAFGPNHGFSTTFATGDKGRHQVCVYVQVGADKAKHPSLGCLTVTVT